MTLLPAIRLVVLFAALAGMLHAQTPAPKPFAPKGRLATTTPVFRWSDTGVQKYSFRLTFDTGGILHDELGINRYTPVGALNPGRYTWQVRSGPLADRNRNSWSEPAAFVIPPETPRPVSPTGWIDRASVKGLKFQFDCELNTQINRFTVELFGEEGSGTRPSTWPATIRRAITR